MNLIVYMKIYEIYLKNNHKIGKRIKTKKKKKKRKENKKKFLKKIKYGKLLNVKLFKC
jgi:hypothetical protein